MSDIKPLLREKINGSPRIHGLLIVNVTRIQTPTARHSEERSNEESKSPRDRDDNSDKDFRPPTVDRVPIERPGVTEGILLLVVSSADIVKVDRG